MATRNALLLQLRSVVIVSVSFVSALFGVVLVLFPLAMVMGPLWPVGWRHVSDRLFGYWLHLPLFLLSNLFGVRVRVSGDALAAGKPSLIFMNHRTRLDWLWFVHVLYRMDPWLLTTWKVSMKKMIKHAPAYGWAMQCNAYLFMERKWEDDQHLLAETVAYLADCGRPVQLLFFPEGTDMDAPAIARCQRYCDKAGLQMYRQLLHPKTKGFVFLVQQMRKFGYLDAVYDVTVAYPTISDEPLVHFEVDFLRGKAPRVVDFHVKRYEERDLPYDDEALAKWLLEVFASKEELLERYYAEDDKKFDDEKRWPEEDSFALKVALFSQFIIWAAATLSWIWFVYQFSPFIWLHFLAVGAAFLYFGWRWGGVQNFVVYCWQWRTERHDVHHAALKKHT